MSKLLLVDDELVLLNAIERILADVGYEVVAASSGAQALAALSEAGSAPPDLIITDVLMEEIDGLQLFSIVRQNPAWQGIPFIFMSASAKPALEKLIADSGRAIFVRKPFAVEGLLKSIDQVVHAVRQS